MKNSVAFLVVVLLFAGILLPACATLARAQQTAADIERDIAAVQPIIDTLESAWQVWQEMHKDNLPSEIAAELRKFEAEIQPLRDKLAALRAKLAKAKGLKS